MTLLSRLLPFGDDPVDAPTYSIRVNGSEIPPNYEVSSIVITRHINKLAMAEIIFFDGDPAAEDLDAHS